MKKYLVLVISFVLVSAVALLNGCKKDSVEDTVDTPKSFREEFINVPNLSSIGWFFINNTPSKAAPWQQGQYGIDKYGFEYGFPAYSYKKDDKKEYAFAGAIYGTDLAISSWMITPVYEIKDGDKISFYTRAMPSGSRQFVDRLQVRLNEENSTADVGNTPTSVGGFTAILKDINESMSIGGYPLSWTRYEITVSGFAAPRKTRIAFRYMPDGTKANGIGIDLFEIHTF